MEIHEKERNYIVTPLSPKLAERETQRIAEEIELLEDNKDIIGIGLDMSFVYDCTIEFIRKITEFKNISLFNIHSDIFAILTSMDIDKKINLYVSEPDFLQREHKLINRKFSLV